MKESIHYRGHDYELKEDEIVEKPEKLRGYARWLERGLRDATLATIEPNRFDPFEALDIIMSFVQTDTQLDKVFADTVRNQVHALRAYITGMKQ